MKRRKALNNTAHILTVWKIEMDCQAKRLFKKIILKLYLSLMIHSLIATLL